MQILIRHRTKGDVLFACDLEPAEYLSALEERLEPGIDFDRLESRLRGPLLGEAVRRALKAGRSLAGANPRLRWLLGLTTTKGDFRGADLSQAELAGAAFWGCDFRGATLTGAWLPGASFCGCDLSGADFSGACLRGADLSGCKLIGVRMVGANLSGTDLAYAEFQNADLSYSCLDGVYLLGKELAGARGIVVDATTPLAILKEQRGPLRAFAMARKDGEAFSGGGVYLSVGCEYFDPEADTNETVLRGRGLDVGTFRECVIYYLGNKGYCLAADRIFLVEFMPEDIAAMPVGRRPVPGTTVQGRP